MNLRQVITWIRNLLVPRTFMSLKHRLFWLLFAVLMLSLSATAELIPSTQTWLPHVKLERQGEEPATVLYLVVAIAVMVLFNLIEILVRRKQAERILQEIANDSNLDPETKRRVIEEILAVLRSR